MHHCLRIITFARFFATSAVFSSLFFSAKQMCHHVHFSFINLIVEQHCLLCTGNLPFSIAYYRSRAIITGDETTVLRH